MEIDETTDAATKSAETRADASAPAGPNSPESETPASTSGADYIAFVN